MAMMAGGTLVRLYTSIQAKAGTTFIVSYAVGKLGGPSGRFGGPTLHFPCIMRLYWQARYLLVALGGP